MYRISKEFTFAMGHRLSCHKGLCKNFHGHNYKMIVGIKSEKLNKDGMVIDFSILKEIVNSFIEIMDHALMVNETDHNFIEKIKEYFPNMKIIETPFEPTAENMVKTSFDALGSKITPLGVIMDYVTIYETDTSKATYSLD